MFLLEKAAGSRRIYRRHWTAVHLDAVADLEGAVSRAANAGARVEQDVRTAVWGKIAVLADPFGHSLCLIQFLNRSYDKLAEPPP